MSRKIIILIEIIVTIGSILLDINKLICIMLNKKEY